MSDYIALLALVVAATALAIAVDVSKRLRDTRTLVCSLAQRFRKLFSIQKATQEVLNTIAEKPCVTLHTVADSAEPKVEE